VVEAGGEGIDNVSAGVSYTLTDHVENLVLTDLSALSGTGNALDNDLAGNSGANALSGLDGADTLIGGAGNDSLDGGTGDDELVGGTGNDLYLVDTAGDVVTENADSGTDTVRTDLGFTLGANVENLELTGSAGVSGSGNALANALTGNTGANALDGAEGNDTLDGGSGADAMTGGSGDDLFVVDNAGDTVVEASDEGLDTVQSGVSYTLSGNVETLTLTGSGNFAATGNVAANLLAGNSGNNLLDGGAGADTMEGGAGNDSYVVDNAADLVTETGGNGTDSVATSVSLSLTANVENASVTGTDGLALTGNGLANTLTGNDGNDTLDGGAGVDTLVGGAGDDLYVVDEGSDAITDNAGSDSVWASASYTLGATLENLLLTASANINGTGNTLANILTGNAGNNTLSGDTGNDTLSGEAGADSLSGGSGNDSLDGGNGADTMTGGTGNDSLQGGADADTLSGNNGNDTIDGGSGADLMTGGTGNDSYLVDDSADSIVEALDAGTDSVVATANYTLSANIETLTLGGSDDLAGTGNSLANTLAGNAGANLLSGGDGRDTLSGGAGADSFSFDSLIGSDVITDFATSSDFFRVSQATLAIGNDDLVVDGATTIGSPGGFAASAELVIVSTVITADDGINEDSAAAAIGSADSAYGLGDTALFVVNDGIDSAVYRFVALDDDNVVSAAELNLLAMLQGAHTVGAGDFVFGG